MTTGALRGLRVVELAGIGPAPFAAMLLADAGADVVRVDRVAHVRGGGGLLPAERDLLARGRRSVGVDLKHPEGVEVVTRLASSADVLLEGFRPGVAERLGLGPEALRARAPRLVYGRMTGWGQEGPWADRVGHDIDYLALAGGLFPIGPAGSPPVPPLNLVADFGGGGAFLAFGVLAAVFERSRSGEGQVVDAAMVDGVAALTAMFHGMAAMGAWTDERGANLLDGGAPFYRCYATSDGGFMAVGALEPQFYAALLEVLSLGASDWPQHDRARWPAQHAALEELFASRTRDQWAAAFEGSDACVAPVLTLSEAPAHPHLAARGTFVEHGGLLQPAPAPRFSRTPSALSRPPVLPGQHTDEVLADAGFSPGEVAALREAGAVA